MQGPDLIRCILLPGSRVKPGPPWEVGWAVALGWSCRMRLHPCRMRRAFRRMPGTWGSSGMNLDQRGKCMCGGRVPVLGGPDTSSLLASASHPLVQPTRWSLGSKRHVSSGGWKHTHRSSRATSPLLSVPPRS